MNCLEQLGLYGLIPVTVLETSASALPVAEALEQAETILADETLSEKDQDKVDVATEKLEAARDGLTEKTDGSGDESGDAGDENENTGDNGSKGDAGKENGNAGRGNAGNDGTANKAPKTGDDTPLTLALLFMVVSGGTAAVVVRRKLR